MKTKQLSDLSKKPSSHQKVKCSQKPIPRSGKTVQPIVNDLVIRYNDAMIHTYQFIPWYYLKQYHDKKHIPEIDAKFIVHCIRGMGIRDNGGRKTGNAELKDELAAFYEGKFKALGTHNKLDRRNMSHLLPYVATQMYIATHNNLKEHFITRMLRFINKTVNCCEKSLDEEQYKAMKNCLKKQILRAQLHLKRRWGGI